MAIVPETSAPLLVAYIDPATGYVIFSALAAILSAVAGVLGVAATATLAFFRRTRKIALAVLVAVALLGGGWYGWAWYRLRPEPIGKRVVVLGIDGLDASLTSAWMAAGRLPNLAALSREGGFLPLGTSNPPQSPVAWASFLTGRQPSGHRVFDFIARDPANYGLRLVFDRPVDGDAAWLPVPTWPELLTQAHVPLTLIGLPLAWPAPEVSGKVLGGMGVPDIAGTQGTFTLVTSDSHQGDLQSGHVVRAPDAGDFQFALSGPVQADVEGLSYLEARIAVARHGDRLAIQVVDDDGASVELAVGETSGWLPVRFGSGWLRTIHGHVRFRLISLQPLRLFVSPVQIALDGGAPLTFPRDWAEDLAEKYGLFHTAGMPYDTWALSDDVLSDAEFLDLADDLTAERHRIVLGELDEFQDGVFFAYYEQVDIIQHLFWRYRDAGHPLYTTAASERVVHAIEQAYVDADRMVGEIRERLMPDDTLLIVSDHGFANFRRSADVNEWLTNMGYMVLRNDGRGLTPMYSNVAWKQTWAYAAGFNGLYLNLRGREGSGIVELDEAGELLDELRDRLLAVTDPETGRRLLSRVVVRVPRPGDMDGPDMLLDYADGFRGSWEAALGGGSGAVVTANDRKWSGDHMVDPDLVPGVLFSNRPLAVTTARLVDLAPTLLQLAGAAEGAAAFDGIPVLSR
ncbi:MAG: hypothetical protein D6761_04340 [Candidatus Dadabacteria bacterium]|nr:MAG: hypothetical protein D6761_04340 [Candidatus Dadabacteria bacterium]